MLEEPQLNGRIASVIREITESAGWEVREELLGALRGPKTKPDVLITRKDGPPTPIVLETEYPPADTLEGDCLKSLGRDVDPSVTGASGKVNAVIAIRATDALHQCANGDEAQRMLQDGHEIEYAVYHPARKLPPREETEKHTDAPIRFPQSGYIKGNIRDLVDFIRPAAEPQETIDEVTEIFENGVADAAILIEGCATHTDIGQHIGTELRQQWPAYPVKPPTAKAEIEQERADAKAREQTAKMTAAILINALAFQQNLDGFSSAVIVDGRKETLTVKSISQIRQPDGTLHPDDVITEWKNILKINYWPIFHIASKLLLLIPTRSAINILDAMAKTANRIQQYTRQNDLAGTLFQRLIADRQTLATYYTRPESTTLAACLAVPDNLNWKDPETLKNYHIADYACGSGGLVLAAYQRARELHRNHGGNPDALHAHMMENSLTACDIMPAAVHLTSSLLTSVAPRERYTGTRCVLYPFGGTGEFDNKRKPLVDIGSLELLDLQTSKYQAVLPLNEQMAMGAMEERRAIEVEMAPLSQSLVIMNPPFTTPTNHAADHAKPGNPAYAAFNTKQGEQKAMSEKVKRLARGTISDGNAGLGSNFSQIAHNMVKPNGHIALILPLSSVLGGTWDGQQEWSWQKLRRLLSDSYNDIIVVSIAQSKDIDASFSADTNIAEAMIVARRLAHNEDALRRAYFVNLHHRPVSKLAAQETARAIRRAIEGLTRLGNAAEIRVGNEIIGAVQLDEASRYNSWPTARVANVGLVKVAKSLAAGQLNLPQLARPIAIPMKPTGKIGQIGPLARDINEAGRGPFETKKGANSGTEWPMLWERDSAVQTKMSTAPDTTGIVRDDKADAAVKLWNKASHLHINITFRFNSNPTIAGYTERTTLGGRAWPNLKMGNPEMEKATCAWLNGTIGLVSYWAESNRVQSGRGTVSITTLANIPTLDVTKLEPARLAAAAQIYDDLGEQRMLPANEAWRDPVRQELDRRLLLEVLGLDDAAVEQLGILRNQWCREPTVTGTKRTGPPG